MIIAGPQSGVGKTTVTAAVGGALRRRGLRVETFKAGPDYIDPSYLTEAVGSPCRNLDTSLLDATAVRELIARRAQSCDIALVEGMMGLFDGRGGDDDSGSTAELARLLAAPVVLVLDVGAMAGSAAAIALGFRQFDARVQFAGVVLNRVAGNAHYAMTARPIELQAGLPVLGFLPIDARLCLPERHLGLIPVDERGPGDQWFSGLAHAAEEHIDLRRLLALSAEFKAPASSPRLFPTGRQPTCTRVAVARDRAFNFYYQDSLDLLEEWGAELVPFSPLCDSSLPRDVDAIYIGGGFPEVYARELAENEGMKRSLAHAVERGALVYGECGGLMYLGRSLASSDADAHEMAGLLPIASDMAADHLTIGYRRVRLRSRAPFANQGEELRGHEFHWSRMTTDPADETAAYEFLDESSRLEGYAVGNVFASYVHLHFGSDPRMAPRFVASSARRSRDG